MALSEEAKKAKREYLREWRKKNKEKYETWENEYWIKKGQEKECQN